MKETAYKESSSFITSVKDDRRQPEELSTTDKTYKAMKSHLDNFDNQMNECWARTKDFYVKKCITVFQDKAKEMLPFYLRKIAEELDNKEKATQLNELHNKLANMKNESETFANTYNNLDRQYKKTKAINLHTEEDNAFLKAQIREKISEISALNLILESICGLIESHKVFSLFNKFNKEEIDVRSVIELMKTVYYKAKRTSKSKVKLERLLEEQKVHYKSTSPCRNFTRRPKRKVVQCSPLEIEDKSDIVERLRQKNAILEQRIRKFKGQKGIQAYKKNELKDNFLNAIGEVKKMISRRKFKVEIVQDLKAADGKSRTGFSRQFQRTVTRLGEMLKPNSEIKWEDFTQEDKLNLVTLVICNKSVLMLLYNKLFPEDEERRNITMNDYLSGLQEGNSHHRLRQPKALEIDNIQFRTGSSVK